MFRTEEYSFSFPKELIANYPSEKREKSKLLVLLPDGEILHLFFHDIVAFFKRGDLLVLNNTEVIKARLWCTKDTGGKIELLFIKRIEKTRWEAIFRGKLKEEEVLKTLKGSTLRVTEFTPRRTIIIEGNEVDEILEEEGELPLPPYIKRKPVKMDENRYQTVFAKVKGAVAAPTAGLHFSEELLKEVKNQGVEISEITLHVSWDTFRPIKEEDIRKHRLHGEYCIVKEDVVKKIIETKKRGGRVIGCGTTVVRALETAGKNGVLKPFDGITELYITPGFKFSVIDLLITNFHFPKSTLLVLVSAFAGKNRILKAYQTAIEKKYRLFSYGDAMLIFKK
jgi:S-adenosylmethionine:tRNA ribosyltransferase-isomerase